MNNQAFSFPTNNPSRHYCPYCFKTLDPQDSDASLRMFVRCESCKTVYHERCQELAQSCVRCADQQTAQQHDQHFSPVQVPLMAAGLPVMIRKPIRYEEKFEAANAAMRRRYAAIAGSLTTSLVVIGMILLGSSLYNAQQAANTTATIVAVRATETSIWATRQLELTTTARSFTATPLPTQTPTPLPTDTPRPTPIPSITPFPSNTLRPTKTRIQPTDAPTSYVGASCPNSAYQRLQIGKRARVTLYPDLKNRINTKAARPSLDSSSRTIGMIPPGDSFMVIDGPICNHNITWWKVSYHGIVGWTGEMENYEYWAEPDE